MSLRYEQCVCIEFFFFAKVLLKIFISLELDLFSWQKWKFHNNDYWIDSFVDTLKRVDYRFTSKSEFIKKYESKNIPVMITHVTDNWKANKHWTEEVFFNTKYVCLITNSLFIVFAKELWISFIQSRRR